MFEAVPNVYTADTYPGQVHPVWERRTKRLHIHTKCYVLCGRICPLFTVYLGMLTLGLFVTSLAALFIIKKAIDYQNTIKNIRYVIVKKSIPIAFSSRHSHALWTAISLALGMYSTEKDFGVCCEAFQARFLGDPMKSSINLASTLSVPWVMAWPYWDLGAIPNDASYQVSAFPQVETNLLIADAAVIKVAFYTVIVLIDFH